MPQISSQHVICLSLVFDQLSSHDRDRWITTAVLKLPDGASRLWHPSESYDDAHLMIQHLLDNKKGCRFAKHLRQSLSFHGLFRGVLSEQKNDQTDTFSVNQVISILGAKPKELCVAALLASCDSSTAVLEMIDQFVPAKTIREKNPSLFLDPAPPAACASE
jgi:hypothetical protein